MAVYTITAPTSGSATLAAWNADETAGIQNLDLRPGAIALSGGWDFAGTIDRVAQTTPASYPIRYYPDNIRSSEPAKVLRQCLSKHLRNINNTNGLSVSTTGQRF